MKLDNETTLSHKFLENMHDAVFILDEDFHIVDCNLKAEKVYGYSHQEFCKLNLNDIRAPSERSKLKIQMHDVLDNEGSCWESEHLRKDGTVFVVEVSSTPIHFGKMHRFYHVVRDISDRKQAEDILRNSEERYRQIVELSPDTIYIHSEGEILFMNKAGLKLFAATKPEQIIGQSVWQLYPAERHGIVRARNQKMLETKQDVPLIEHTMQRLDGKRIEVEAIARYIKYENKDAFYVIIRDISERKKNNLLLKMQYAVSRELIESVSLVDTVTNVLSEICNNLRLHSAKAWVFDAKFSVLRCMSVWNVDLGHEVTLKIGEGLAGKALKERTVVFDNGSSLAIPILNKQEIIGVMEFAIGIELEQDQPIIDALVGIANQLGSFIKRKTFEKDLIYISKHDAITGLSNRFLFQETLTLAINIARNNDQKLALLFIDVNQFSSINEGMGHTIGDELLKDIAERLLKIGCRIDTLARFGADQFTLILSNIAHVEDVTNFAAKINETLTKPFNIQGNILNITINIGVALYPEDSEDAQTLLKNANIALSHAKALGHGALQFCSLDMTTKAKKRINIERDLRVALTNNEFELFYQPIVTTSNNEITGVEALVRWRHQDQYISPAEFIPIAERTQLIVQIGKWVLETACKQAKTWSTTIKKPISVAVNISSVQFKQVKIIDLLQDVLTKTGLDPTLLKVELTESGILEDVNTSINTLKKIKEMGVKVCIDDFGTGYSSLSYLTKLPIDYIKIDQSFVRDVTNDANDAAIVRTIIDLARNLGYKVIAEGVETEAQLHFLNGLGCSEIQGYYFSRPMPAEEATQFLNQDKLI